MTAAVMVVFGFPDTIPFLILGTVVIAAGTFVQRMFDCAREANPLLLNAYSASDLCVFVDNVTFM